MDGSLRAGSLQAMLAFATTSNAVDITMESVDDIQRASARSAPRG